MQTSQRAIELLKDIEKVRYAAYLDSGGVPTIGVGHTRGVKLGDLIDDAQVNAFLHEDLKGAERDVEQYVRVLLSQQEFDALVLFVFNIGGPQFATSTMLTLLNRGNRAGAAAQFARWKYDNGRVMGGLVRRRLSEHDVFLHGVYFYDAAH